ncbi:ABC transporter substrate-binding protein [Phytoactinopolyspora mesophila]|nr:ABC transporter substrate-binding protein [Phytoactinopolyspora mesophila]
MRTRFLAAGAAALMVLISACGGSGDAEPTEEPAERAPVEDGTFRAVIAADPGNLDPLMTVLSNTRWVTTFMYDSLIFINEEGDAVPYLAESWEVGLDEVTYTLAEGITCSDGTPLTASDVAANFEFVADPANGSPQLGVWVPPGVAVTADDDARTVTLTSPNPDPFLLQATGLLQIVCAAGTADRSILESGAAGTGMFELAAVAPNDHYTFERRDDYEWGPEGAAASDPGTPKSVTLHVVGNESTAVNMFLADEIDAVLPTGPDAQRAEQSGADIMEITAPLGQLYFNQADGRAGADPAVRLALTQAADLTALGTVTADGRGKPSEGVGGLEPRPCPADTVTGSLPAHDVDGAAQQLEDAGWEAGPDGVRAKEGQPLALSLLYVVDIGPGLAAGAELLAQQWSAIGVDVSLQSITQAQINEVLFGSGDWDAGLIMLSVAFPSQLGPFFSGPVPPDGTNFAHLGNEEYEALTAEAAELPLEEGCALWEDAERALVSQADVVPFVDLVTPMFLNGVESRLLANNLSPPTIRMYE